MRVGVVGLGKLGLPVALALAVAGHDVAGMDVNRAREHAICDPDTDAANLAELPEVEYEPQVAELLGKARLRICPLGWICRWAEIILICVQTPHDPRFEGVTPLQDDPQDFDYSYLRAAVSEIAATGTDALVVIVSTCLPGTFDREIRPIAGDLRMAYHPLFIAMGSVIEDFRDPEFVLVGSDSGETPSELEELYAPVFWSPVIKRFRNMSITSAELTKVAYNAAIGFKILLANTVAELSDKIGADCDDIMSTLKLATDRLVSTQYMTPGMGDGGGCHPRDQIALSWLAGETSLSHDPFGLVIRAREAHAEWLADLWWAESQASCLPPLMLGGAYKPNTHLRTGSHALLVAHYIADRYPVRVEDEPLDLWPVACYFLATPHDHFLEAPVPAGSVMVDPWGLFREREGVRIVRPGRREDFHQLSGSGVKPAATGRMA